MYIGLLLFSFLLEFAQTYIMQWTGQKVMFDLRSQIFRHLQRLHISFFDKNPVGRLVTRVTSDVDALNEMFTSGVVSIFEDVFVLAGIMVIMLNMSWRLALITFAVLPLIFYATSIFRRKVRDSYRRIRIAIARINAYLQEHVTGIVVLQLFNREKRSYRASSRTSTARTWTRSKTRSWRTRSTTPSWKCCRRSPIACGHLVRRPPGAAQTCSRSACWSPSCNTRSASSGRSRT